MKNCSNRLAVFFPGVGYHCDKPLLYYAGKIASEEGYEEIIRLSYSSEIKNIRGDKAKMKMVFDELYARTETALSEVNWSEYDDILFVSKSVGTAIACAYAKHHGIDCRQVLYTPLEATYIFEPKNAIAFTGDADPWVVHEDLLKCSSDASVPTTVIEGADHSLETGNTARNLEILSDVMEKTKLFIQTK